MLHAAGGFPENGALRRSVGGPLRRLGSGSSTSPAPKASA